VTEQKKRPRNRNRNRGGGHSSELATQAAGASAGTPARSVDPAITPMPNWRWKTFPVYFALTAGLMLGVYLGWIAGFVASDQGNQTPTTVTFIVAALLFGFALSRLSTRWLISRRWIKPRAKK
jgi:hypothetical protein